jgi:hypothetical protein
VKGAHAGRTGLTITDVSIDDLANCQTRYHSTFTTSTPSNSVSIHTSCSVSECDEREGSTRKTHPRRPRASALGPGFLASSKSPASKRGQRTRGGSCYQSVDIIDITTILTTIYNATTYNSQSHSIYQNYQQFILLLHSAWITVV